MLSIMPAEDMMDKQWTIVYYVINNASRRHDSIMPAEDMMDKQRTREF